MNGMFCVAVHALICLDKRGCMLSSEELATNICTNPARVRKIMSKLKKAGLVKSIRGASGGYVLEKKPSEISVGDILRALEGSLEPVKCAAIDTTTGEGCMASDGCVTKYVWQKINDSINDTVNQIMLDELIRESKSINPDGECENPKCSQ